MPATYPDWVLDATPNTSSHAIPTRLREVLDVPAIRVSGATYRNCQPIDGVFELVNRSPQWFRGKEHFEVYCAWFGVKPPNKYPRLSVCPGGYELLPSYTGSVIDNLSDGSPVTAAAAMVEVALPKEVSTAGLATSNPKIEQTSKARFPLRKAYAFAVANGLAREAAEVQSTKIEWDRTTSTVHRGMMLRLFRARGLLHKFVTEEWPFGSTKPGKTERLHCLRVADEYDEFLRETSAGEGNPVEAAKFFERFSADVQRSLRDSRSDRLRRLRNASKTPARVRVLSYDFMRNPDVVAEVLLRASGACERCHAAAPFARRTDGSPYLEVHHKTSLADGGEDTVENAVALCPNCHRRLHHGPSEP